MPGTKEAEIERRGGALRWRSRCRDGVLWRFAVVRRPGPRGGKVVAYSTGKRC